MFFIHLWAQSDRTKIPYCMEKKVTVRGAVYPEIYQKSFHVRKMRLLKIEDSIKAIVNDAIKCLG